MSNEFHVGQGVVYHAYPGAKPEDGTITSMNAEYVFVRYAGDDHSKATRRVNLQPLLRQQGETQ